MSKFMENPGGCVVSKNILEEKGAVKWCFREEPVDENDNGWRFFSDIDDEEYLQDDENLTICDFNTVANIDPAIIIIYNMPVGTDLELVKDGKKSIFLDANTGQEIDFIS